MSETPLPRLIAPGLENSLSVMPAVVVTGARQTGKSTLAQKLMPGPRRFLTLNDLDALHIARNDPDALLDGEMPVTSDEVQRAPFLLHAVKRAIDRSRRPGMFLLRFLAAPQGLGSPGQQVAWGTPRFRLVRTVEMAIAGTGLSTHQCGRQPNARSCR